MKAKRKTIFTILCIILFFFSLAVIFFFRNWLLVKPYEPFALTEVITACRDKDQNLYVIDKSGERVLKASADGTLLWQLKASSAPFEKALRICVDEEGQIYLLDRQIKSGIRLKQEAILQFSPDGTYLKTLYKRKARQDQIRPTIVGLFASGQDATTVLVEPDKLVVRDLVSCETRSFPLRDAEELVLNACWDPVSGSLWYLTFHGRIYRYEDGEKDDLIYDNSKYVEEFESVPRAVSYLNGTLYAADRGLRCLLAIDTYSGTVHQLPEELPWNEREICDSVTSDYSVVSTTGSVVKIWNQEQCEDISEFTLSSSLKIMTWLLWFSLVIMAFSLISVLLLLMFYLIRKAGTMARIVTMILIGVSALAAMLIGTLFPSFRQQLYDARFEKAEYCASLTMERMPVKSFLNLDESSDYLGEDYMTVRNAVDSVFKTGSDSVDDLYCTMYRVFGENNTIAVAYSMDENSMLLPYDWEYEDSEEQAILTSGKGRQYINRSVEGSYLFVLDPIKDYTGNAVGLIEVGTDLDSFEREVRQIFYDLLLNLIAVTAVAVMLIIEIVYFVRGRRQYHAQEKTDTGLTSIPAGLLRMIVFLVFFFTNLTTAVLPVYAIKLASSLKIPWISTEVLAAVPFSAEVIAGALFSLLGAGMIRKLSLKRAALLCAVLFSAGLGLRIIPSFWMITLGSIVIGIGWGVILLIVNVLIADMPGSQKDTGFAYYNSAALNGVNSGTVFGGFLLNWLPSHALFALTAAASLLLLVLVGKYLIHCLYQGNNEETEGEDNPQISFRQFLFSPNILIFFGMLVIPVLTGSYFLIYLFPIIGTRWGLSETYVGYSYLLNGLCVMAFSTLMTNLFTRARKKRFGLMLSALLYAGAFSIVALFRNVPALLAALLILGFSDSFGLPLQTSFYTDQKEVERFGFDRSLGVYSLFENTSQALGPFVFSWALVVGVSKGLYVIAAVIAALAIVFMISGLFFRRKSSAGK